MPSLKELKGKFLEEEARRSQNGRDYGLNKEEALLAKKKVPQEWEQSEQKDTHTEQGKRLESIQVKAKLRYKMKENAMQAISLKVNLQKPGVWCLDSRTTMYKCNDKERFVNLDEDKTTRIYAAAENNMDSDGTE
ncbi:hypothetical protein KM043_014443 [Ampulex compressa]|nr:hypothetical protein KM043_014443 [Ampulex compressa]